MKLYIESNDDENEDDDNDNNHYNESKPIGSNVI